MKHIKNILITIIVLLFSLYTFISPNASTNAKTLGGLKNELAALKNKKAQKENEKKLTQGQIASSNQSISNAKNEITVNQGKVEQAKNIENRKTVSARFFNDKMSKFAASINKNMTTAEKLIAKKNLSKKDQEELRMMLYGIQTELTSNIPFFRQMFQEEMDKIAFGNFERVVKECIG